MPAALVALAAGGAGCGGDRGDPVARAIADTFARELGQRPRVTCRATTCTATLPDGAAIPITRDGATWESPELLDGRAVAARVVDELAALGLTDTADCGPVLVAPPVPTALTCTLGGGGTAWVTVDAVGDLALDVALTAAEAAARTEGADDAALERASRALDTEEAEGNPEDGIAEDGQDDPSAPPR